MPKRYIVTVDGEKCSLRDLRPGLFLCNGYIGLKTEYGSDEAYCDTGEAFCSDAPVQPVEVEALTPKRLRQLWASYTSNLREKRTGGHNGGRPPIPTPCPRCGEVQPSRAQARGHRCGEGK